MHTFEEISKLQPYRDAQQWQARVGSARIGVRHMTLDRGEIEHSPAENAVLIVYHRPARIAHNIDGDQREARHFLPGDMILRTPGLNWLSDYLDPVEVTTFALDAPTVQSITTQFCADLGEVFGRLEVRPFRSPLIQALATQLAALAETEGDRLHADALTSAMIHELWRMAEGSDPAQEIPQGKLGGHTLRRIDTEIDNAAAAKLTLEDLAASVGMSTPAFAAAMKETTGQTPYQYVLARRLGRARAMVETTTLSLAEIAFRCGFSSQSHMTDVFRTKLGTSPGKLRASRI